MLIIVKFTVELLTVGNRVQYLIRTIFLEL